MDKATFEYIKRWYDGLLTSEEAMQGIFTTALGKEISYDSSGRLVNLNQS